MLMLGPKGVDAVREKPSVAGELELEVVESPHGLVDASVDPVVFGVDVAEPEKVVANRGPRRFENWLPNSVDCFIQVVDQIHF